MFKLIFGRYVKSVGIFLEKPKRGISTFPFVKTSMRRKQSYGLQKNLNTQGLFK